VLLSPAASGPSAALQAVIDSVILETGALAKTVTPDGGVKVIKLRDVLRGVAMRHGLVHPTGDTFAAGELAWENRELALAVAIQAGRAATNNGGLVSVLAAAARPDVDWLILVLPERYKRGPTYGDVLKQVSALSGADGIDLDLVGVTLIGF
jgi:hypothetical protein